jgi:hypothetical protein
MGNEWRSESGNEQPAVGGSRARENRVLRLTGIQLRSMRPSFSLSELSQRSGLNTSASGPKTDVSR